MDQLYWNTVNELLSDILNQVMAASEFDDFRLVGGTSLSLQIGHRMSVDIDLFTDADYGSIDFNAIDNFFRSHYSYVATNGGLIGMGTSYYAGHNEQHAIKLDLYYTDPFIFPEREEDGVRMATIEEVLAMKLDVIARGGRKKDFWDIYALIDRFSLKDMLKFYEQRYPYGYDQFQIYQKMVDFEEANNDFDPVCLRGEHWELIKYELERWTNKATQFFKPS